MSAEKIDRRRSDQNVKVKIKIAQSITSCRVIVCRGKINLVIHRPSRRVSRWENPEAVGLKDEIEAEEAKETAE